jgi:hypothetical protein
VALNNAGENNLYYNSDNVMRIMGSLSLTNEYKVAIRWGTAASTGGLVGYIGNLIAPPYGVAETGYDFGFFASEAVLPGSNLVSQEIYGNYQGLNQSLAVSRQYPEIEITFYIDAGHNSLLVMQAWQEFIVNTLDTNNSDFRTAVKKLRYPDFYKCDVLIRKFNRDFRSTSEKLKSAGSTQEPASLTYNLKRAYPTKIISTPVSYGEAQILKTVVSFSYENYVLSKRDRATTDGGLKEIRVP